MNSAPSNPQEPSGTGKKPTCACGPWWRLPLLLGLVLLALLLFNGRGLRDNGSETSSPVATEKVGDANISPVSLIIVVGEGHDLVLDDIDWHPGITVGDIMQAAPRVSYVRQGSGASAFLTSINGVANEGSGGRNWMYSVNGQRGDRSYAVYELKPGDRVMWTFTPPGQNQ